MKHPLIPDAVEVFLWPVMFACAALIFTVVLVPVRSFRMRNIPGPHALPFVGNLLDIMKVGSSPYFATCAAKYGSVFKVWFGRLPYVIVTDPKLASAVGNLVERYQLRHLLRGADAQQEVYGLASARDTTWLTTRLAWQPAFHSPALASYFSLMDHAACKLVAHLGKAAKAGTPIDIWEQLGSMTLAVNGSIAYGVDFATMTTAKGGAGLTPRTSESSAPPGQPPLQPVSPEKYGARLLQACQVLFTTSSLAKHSAWFKLNLILPELNRLISALAYAMPDAAFSANLQARATIKRTSLELLRASGAANKAGGTQPGERPTSVGIAADSFLGMLLAQRAWTSMRGLTDAEILSQAMTFLLAGYETTANALAFTIHSIAANPEVQARLLAEIDAFGRDRDVTSDDLAQFPYIAATLNESMRLYPPAPAVTRVSPVVVDLGGHRVPPGTSIMISFYAMHRDPAIWPEPDRFLPERFLEAATPYSARMPGAHLPFGLGPRMCIGRKFAVREVIVTLVRLYQRYVFVLQPGQVPLVTVNGMNGDNTYTLAPKHGVHVIVRRRQDSA